MSEFVAELGDAAARAAANDDDDMPAPQALALKTRTSGSVVERALTTPVAMFSAAPFGRSVVPTGEIPRRSLQAAERAAEAPKRKNYLAANASYFLLASIC